MAERFGYRTIKDALVTLIGTTNVDNLNNGLSRSVQQVVALKPDNIVIPDSKYPTVCVWLDSVTETFEGASKRRKAICNFRLDFWVKSLGSVDTAIDQSQLLGDNIMYILSNNTSIANLSSTRGWINSLDLRYEYNTDTSGFISHGIINLEVMRILN